MNFNAVNVVMFGIGAVLIYSAIKNLNPKDVVTGALAQSAAKSANAPAGGGASGGRPVAHASAVSPNTTAPGNGASYAQPFVVTSN